MAKPTVADALLNAANTAKDQPYGSQYVPLHHWITDDLKPEYVLRTIRPDDPMPDITQFEQVTDELKPKVRDGSG